MAVMLVLRGFSENGTMHLLQFSAALLVANMLSWEKRVDLWLSLLGLAQAVFGIFEWYGWNPWDYVNPDALNKPLGTFGQETTMGAFLVACLAPALFGRRWWAALPILVCIYATGSSMTLGAAGVVVLLFCWHELGWRLPAAAAVGGACALAWLRIRHPDAELLSGNGRWGFWNVAWRNYIVQRPLFGFGPGFWYPQAPLVPSPYLSEPQHLTHIHNEFLELLVEYGFVGAAPLIWQFCQFVRRFRLTWHHALCAGLLVNAVGNFPAHIASTATIFLTAWLLSVRKEGVVLSLSG